MSRGGRGRGGSRGGRGGTTRVAGHDLPVDQDLGHVVSNKPRELFPVSASKSARVARLKGAHMSACTPANFLTGLKDMVIPDAQPPTAVEKAQVEQYRAIRKRIHDGPLYTTTEAFFETTRPVVSNATSIDPFEAMPTYSHKYKPPLRRVPDLSGRTYESKFFPLELWDVLGLKRPTEGGSGRRAKRRKIGTGLASKTTKQAGDAAKEIKKTEEGVPEADEEGEGDEDKLDADEDDDERSEPDPEDDFSEDEEEMADDYNAEKYFETGEGEDDDIGDAGDDGGYD